MVTVRVCSKLKTSCKSFVFPSEVGKSSRYFVGGFNKTIISLALVGYETVIAISALRASLSRSISYPTRTRGIIVNYLVDLIILSRLNGKINTCAPKRSRVQRMSFVLFKLLW